jgi:hypothetical protein
MIAHAAFRFMNAAAIARPIFVNEILLSHVCAPSQKCGLFISYDCAASSMFKMIFTSRKYEMRA